MRQKNLLKRALITLYLLVSGPTTLTLQAAPDPTPSGPTPTVADGAHFVVVVHADNPTNSVSRKELSRIFLHKTKGWIPVDQNAGSAVRKTFSQVIHGKHVKAIQGYWQRQIFSGRNTPPQCFDTDEEVLDYVREHPNAVGYVSSSTPIGDGVKVLRIS